MKEQMSFGRNQSRGNKAPVKRRSEDSRAQRAARHQRQERLSSVRERELAGL